MPLKLSSLPATLKARLEADAWLIANDVAVILGPETAADPSAVLGEHLEALKDNALVVIVEQPGGARLAETRSGRVLLLVQVSLVFVEASAINRATGGGGADVQPLVAIEEILSAAIDPDDVTVGSEAWASLGAKDGNLFWRINLEARIALNPRA